MARVMSYIGRPHVGTCQRYPPAKLGSINIQYKPQGYEGEAHWARRRLGFITSLGLSAGGRLKARRKTANGLTPPLRTNERTIAMCALIAVMIRLHLI